MSTVALLTRCGSWRKVIFLVLRCWSAYLDTANETTQVNDVLVRTWWIVVVRIKGTQRGPGNESYSLDACRLLIDFSRVLSRVLFQGRLWPFRGVCGSPRYLRPRHCLALVGPASARSPGHPSTPTVRSTRIMSL